MDRREIEARVVGRRPGRKQEPMSPTRKQPTGSGRLEKSRDPLGDSAYERIRGAIRDGQLTPGSRIVESELASWLGVSRTPIREAVLRLEQDGLITYVPRYGLTVASLDYQAVIELYAMREVLEGTAARFAASHASVAELETLKEMLEVERSLDDAASDRAARANRQFHQILYFAAHNRFLLKSLNALSDSMMLLGHTTLAMPGRHKTAVEEHMAIVEAITKRQAEAAEHAARAHIREAQRHRVKMIISAGNETTSVGGAAEARRDFPAGND